MVSLESKSKESQDYLLHFRNCMCAAKKILGEFDIDDRILGRLNGHSVIKVVTFGSRDLPQQIPSNLTTSPSVKFGWPT